MRKLYLRHLLFVTALFIVADVYSQCPLPTITGPKSVSASDGEITYTTQPGKINYSWNIFNGTVVSGQGTNTIRVRWPMYVREGRLKVSYKNADGTCSVSSTDFFVNHYDISCAPTAANVWDVTSRVTYGGVVIDAEISYGTTTQAPTKYMVDWETLNDIDWSPLQPNKIVIHKDSRITAPGFYHGKLFLLNNAGCISAEYPIHMLVLEPYFVELSSYNQKVCLGTTSRNVPYVINRGFPYLGNHTYIEYPTKYSIDWNGDCPDVPATSLGSSGKLTINFPAAVGTCSGTISFLSNTGDVINSHTINLEVKALPGNPLVSDLITVCSGATSSHFGLIYGSYTEVNVYSNHWSGGNVTISPQIPVDNIPSTPGIYPGELWHRDNMDYSAPTEYLPYLQCASMFPVTVKVVNKPLIQTSNKAICSGQTTDLSLSSSVPGSKFEWYVRSVSSNISGATTSMHDTTRLITHTLTNASATLTGTVVYRVTSKIGYCYGDYKDITVTVNPKPAVTASANNIMICSGSSTDLTASGASSYTWSPSSPLLINPSSGTPVSATPKNTTTYTVTGTNAYGCTNTADVTVFVMGSPTTSIWPESATICPNGGAVWLYAEASREPLSYQWRRNGAVVGGNSAYYLATSAGSYSLTVTNQNGCSGSTSPFSPTVVSIAHAPQPYISTSYSLCIEQYVLLEASYGATEYRWSNGYVTQTNQLHVYEGGNYWVEAYYDNGCTSAASPVIYVQPCTPDPCQGPWDPNCQCIENGVQVECLPMPNAKAAETGSLGIYPNPANDVVSIEIPEAAETKLEVKMISQFGHQVATSSIQKGAVSTTLDSRNVADGVYIVLVKSDKGTVIRQKLIIKH